MLVAQLCPALCNTMAEAWQALLSMGFSRQECWNGLPFPFHIASIVYGLPRWLSGKETTYQAGDAASIPGSGRSPGEGNGKPLHCSCLGNSIDRGACLRCSSLGHKELDRTSQLSVSMINSIHMSIPISQIFPPFFPLDEPYSNENDSSLAPHVCTVL